ncbi:amino acid ABC transporter ATP-binding protein [Candidatus Bathyarchaeota archaeon]|nr:amino acid ABC transporter ATP-binding protein [Candidatus Bathyarchaeota archaeon]
MTSTVMESRHLWKAYEAHLVAVKDVSFRISEGEIKLIFGPSGSGKSTFLRCLAMLTTPDKGDVFLRDVCLTKPGVDLNRARARIGFVFQHIWLFRHLTALDNVELALRRVLKLPKTEAKERALQALREVKVEEWAHHYPAQLSGGQQQRVGIARALARNPDIILLDEPTSALDPELTGEVIDTLRDLAKKGTTMLIVSHEMPFAREIADEMIFYDEGAIVETGPPEQFFTNPQSERAQKFMIRLIKKTKRE